MTTQLTAYGRHLFERAWCVAQLVCFVGNLSRAARQKLERDAWLRTYGGQCEELHWEALRLHAELLHHSRLARIIDWLLARLGTRKDSTP